MRNLLLGAALAVSVGPAFAADLPTRRVAPVFTPSAPVFSWSGLYIGGQVGYAFGRDDISSSVFAAPRVFSYSPKGIIGGAHIGYNFSAPGLGGLLGSSAIIGIEADVNGSDFSRTVANPLSPLFASVGTRMPVDGSVRGRLGFAVDRALFYATGGVAFASLTNIYTQPNVTTSVSSGRVGYTVGGGVEYAVTDAWSLRAEYRYTDFGTFTEFPGSVIAGRNNHEVNNRAQVGASYKFDFGPTVPVVARY